MKNILTILILFLLVTGINAQTAREYLSPVASPQASVSQNVGMTNITIKYSSPGVKGRTIFGDLVPYNELWRASKILAAVIAYLPFKGTFIEFLTCCFENKIGSLVSIKLTFSS